MSALINVVIYVENGQLSLDLQSKEVMDSSAQTLVRTEEFTPEKPENANFLALVALANTATWDNDTIGRELEALLNWTLRLGESIERERVANVLGINHKKGE